MTEDKYHRAAKPEITVTYDLMSSCCKEDVSRWTEWFIPTCALYLPGVKLDKRAKRNIRKAAELYEVVYGFEHHNNHLDDIHAIKTSIPVRQNEPMNPKYYIYPKKLSTQYPCDNHRMHFHAVKRDGHLWGFITSRRIGEIAKGSIIIGHGDHLKNGIMSLLMQEVVKFHGCPFVYGRWRAGTDGLRLWKYHNGFRPAKTNVK